MSINLEKNVEILSEHYVNRFKHLIDTNRKEDAFSIGEEYVDWYFENLEDTKKVLDKLFAYEEIAEDGHHFDNFYYQSSW